MPSRLQDRTEGLKFKNLKPGWKAKSLALPVYRDSSGQTSLFSTQNVEVIVVVIVVVAVVVVVVVVKVKVKVKVIIAQNENSHDNTGVASIIIMIRTTSPCSQHDDDTTVLRQAWMVFKKTGGLGGAQPPPFANKMIRKTFPYCKHGDDS